MKIQQKVVKGEQLMKRWYMVCLRDGRSQFDIARNAGMTQQYYGMIENGRRGSNMGLGIMERLAGAFGVLPEELIRLEKKHKEGAWGQTCGKEGKDAAY